MAALEGLMVQVPDKTRPRLFLIDGYALIYRAFFAMISRPLTTSRGENTSAAWGLTQFLRKILSEHDPDYLGVVLDAGTSQRTERYPAYKATREKMPTELESSMPRIHALLEAFRVPLIRLADHEADDVIGTLARQAAERDLESVIVSGDKDFYQLIRPGVSLLNPGRGGSAGVEEEWVDERNASERLGVPPAHVVDYLALIGDASDNIPGAPGIGPKTAIQLIQKYGTVEEILAHAAEVPNKRARESLLTHADEVRLSKELVTILSDLPVQLDLEALELKQPDTEALRALFMDLEFHTLVREYAPRETTVRFEKQYRIVQDVREAAALARSARERGTIGLAAEGSRSEAMRSDLVGVSIALEPGRAYYLPFAHRRSGELALGDSSSNLPPLDSPAMSELRAVLEDVDIRKIGHDLKHDLLVLRRAGVELRGIAFDTMVASYVLDPGRRDHDLDALALQFLEYRTTTYEELRGKGRDEVPIAECPVARVGDFVSESADIALRLREIFADELEKLGLDGLFDEMEVPLITVLADMERAGIRIDLDFFRSTGQRLGGELELIRDDIYRLAGGEFNINSTLQLREVLFDRLKLPVVKKTKTGASTDVSVLEELAEQGHELPRLLIDYRQLDKLKSTYVDALPALVNQTTGRIHTTFNQAVAATGRLSSSDPNLQNIPIRTDVGAELRKGFVPEPGSLFLSADYSQIELRVLAHLSGDPAFVDAFRRRSDIHRETAALVFGVTVDQVTPDMRAAAKTINFATVYGISPFNLAQKLGTSNAEAKQFIDEYFRRFEGVRRYLDTQIEKARQDGYVETISGRRRYIPEVRHRNYGIRQFGERAATNAPVQGSAADIIKLAMIRIAAELRRAGGGGRMLLQVHDELVFEVPADEIDDSRALVKREMESAFALAVPLEVASGVGENWFECK